MSSRGHRISVQRPAPAVPGVRFARALFDFAPSVQEELRLELGDVIKILRRIDDFWLQGTKLHNGEIGQFPRDFVKDITLPKISNHETLLYALDTFYPEADGDLPFDKGDIVILERKINDEWGSGSCGSSKGMFPLNYTDLLLPPTISSLEETQKSAKLPDKEVTNIPGQDDGIGLARATMSLTAQLDEELSFNVGDKITVLEVMEDGWLKGRLGDNIGTFPASFVQLLTSLKSPKTPRKEVSSAALLMRTGSKAWKEQELDPVLNNVTNNNNYDSDHEPVENVPGVTDGKFVTISPDMTKEIQCSEQEVQSKSIAGATTEQSTVAEDYSSKKEILFTVTAMYKFTGNTELELSFEKDTEISIFEEVDEHWYMGIVGTQEGYIARAYVSKPQKITRTENEDGSPQKTDKNNTQKPDGYVKSTSNQLLNKHHVYTATPRVSDPVKSGKSETEQLSLKRALAVYDYQARNQFDLTVSTGDVVWIIREVDENWVEVKNDVGKKGIVPINYIQYSVEGGVETPAVPASPNENLGKSGDAETHFPPHPMPVLHEDETAANGRVASPNIERYTTFSSPKPFIAKKPQTLPVHSSTQKRKSLQKSISVDSGRVQSPNGDEGSLVNRSNSNPQSFYSLRAKDSRPHLKAWQNARKMSSPTAPKTPPNETSIATEIDSKKSNFVRSSNRSASMRERRIRRKPEDNQKQDVGFVKIKSDSDLSIEAGLMQQRHRNNTSEGRKISRGRRVSGEGRRDRTNGGSSKMWYIDSASTTSTGSSSSYGDSRTSHPGQSEVSGSDTSSVASRKSSSVKIRRSAPPVPPHNRQQDFGTPEQTYPPSPWSPPIPARKQSLQHDSRRRLTDTISPEMIQNSVTPGSLVPSRPAPELPPRTPAMSPVKKIPPMRPANPPRSRSPNTKLANDGTQERVRNITSRGLKEKIEKVRSDIEDYSRMKRDLENLYQGTLDGRERREISENMEFVKANLKRLQNEFHSLIEGQEDHIYESLDMHMQHPPNENNSFERLPAPPPPPVIESPGSIRKKRIEKRLLVASELVNTERDFLKDVTVTIEDIMNELIDRQISQTTIGTLFVNIVQVKEFSERLLMQLEEALRNESSEQPDYEGTTIGQVFIDNNPEMKEVYMPYCRNHDDAMTMVEKLHDDAEFMQAVQACLESIKNKVNVFDLGSFLIKPVQRFLKYPLLIEELIKLTDASTPDNPSDQDKLILAHKLMQSLAKDINEDKRIKDLVRKYKDGSNEGISEKLGKLSMKTIKKKSSRISKKIGLATGISTRETRDVQFDEIERKFKTMERAAKLFVQNISSYCDKCRDVLCAEGVVAQAMISMVFEYDHSHPVALYQSMADKMSGPLYRQFHDQVQLQVLSPVQSLIVSFKSPQTIIDKRGDKLIDYERLLKHSDSKDKIEAAKHNYEALNKSLLDELPKLCDLGLKLLTSCTAIFARFHRDFEAKLLNELKPLLAIIQSSGGNEPKIPTNMETYDRFRPAYVEAINTISRLQVVPASFSSLFGSQKGVDAAQRKPTQRYQEMSQALKQPKDDREGLRRKYQQQQLYVADKNYNASLPADLSCCESDLVAVLKQQDPMGSSQRWFVDRGGPGNSTGFLPSNILRSYDPSRDESLMAFSPSPPSPQPTPRTPIPTQRQRSPTPSSRSTDSTGSSESAKPPLSPYTLRQTLTRGTLPPRGDGSPSEFTDAAILEIFQEEDEIFDDTEYGDITTSPKSSKQHFRVDYDFTSRSDLELTVRTGNIVKLIMAHDSDGNAEWWLVSNGEGNQGYVPSNYLTKAEYL